MPVLYRGNAFIPAPFFTIAREEVLAEDGRLLKYVYPISIRGTLATDKGSPNSAGAFWTLSGSPPDESIPAAGRFTAILKKQEAIRHLFAVSGGTLEIQGNDGFTPFKCNPRVKRVTFADAQGKGVNWTEACEYTVELEADCVHGLLYGDECAGVVGAQVSRASNEWNVELVDEAKQTYRLTHAVSATGTRHYDETGALTKEAWEQARDYVLGLVSGGVGLGLVPDRMSAPAVLDATALQAFNYVRSQSVNELAGTFAATETWVCYDPKGEPPAVNDYTVEQRYARADNRTTVTVQGTITGLQVGNNSTYAVATTRWQNARDKWLTKVLPFMLSTAQNTVGVSLNPVPVEATFGFNENAGVVTYRYGFDDRPTPVVPGAVSEVLTVTDQNAADVFARVPVLGRPYGPVLQGLGTVTEKKRTITIEVLMPPSNTGFLAAAPNTDLTVLELAPAGGLALFLEEDQVSWTPNTGRYTRQTVYVWE
jgi:hypothetical protein